MMPSTHSSDEGQPVAGLRIVVVEPDPGAPHGAAARALAERLVAAGHQVEVVGWSTTSPPSGTVRSRPLLSVRRPDLWARAGRHVARGDLVLLFPPRTPHLPGAIALARSLATRGPGDAGRGGPCVVAIVPEEPDTSAPVSGRLRRTLLSRLFSFLDAAIVHSEAQAKAAHAAGLEQVVVQPAPSPAQAPSRRRGSSVSLLVLRPGDPRQLAALSRAVQGVPSASLTILEPAGSPSKDLRKEALNGVTRVQPRRVEAQLLADLLDDHDVLVLTDASTRADVALARSHGLPMVVPAELAGAVGLQDPAAEAVLVPMAGDTVGVEAGAGGGWDVADTSAAGRPAGPVRGTDAPADGDRWARAIAAAAARWGPSTVAQSPLSSEWANYIARIEVLAAAGPSSADGSGADGSGDGSPTGADTAPSRLAGLVRSSSRAVRARARARRPVLRVGSGDLPAGLLATDVLVDPGQVEHARDAALGAGMPWSRDGTQAWAAIGSVAAVLRVCGDPAHTVIVDESGPRSLFTRWMRRLGYAPVVLDFTGSSASLGAMDIDAGSLDVIVRLHPDGCEADTAHGVIEQAGWALRPGGMLIITLPLGPVSAPGCVGAADVRALLAFADGEGLSLIGDLDGHLRVRMTAARDRARSDRHAFGLVRLAWRKR